MKSTKWALIFAAGLGACSASVKTNDTAGPGVTPHSDKAQQLSALQGAWTTGCIASEEQGMYQIENVSFTGSQFTYDAVATMDAACTETISSSIDHHSGTFAIGDAVAGGADMTQLNLTTDGTQGGAAQNLYTLFQFQGGTLYLGDIVTDPKFVLPVLNTASPLKHGTTPLP